MVDQSLQTSSNSEEGGIQERDNEQNRGKTVWVLKVQKYNVTE